jgi:putative membrane protein
MMGKFFIRWIINALALAAAIYIVPGIHLNPVTPLWLEILVLALIFGFLNALLRPLLTILTCPLILLTLGLGTLLINTLLFYLTGWVGTQFGWGFTVAGFWPAFLGALVVSVVSIVLTGIVREDRRQPYVRTWHS